MWGTVHDHDPGSHRRRGNPPPYPGCLITDSGLAHPPAIGHKTIGIHMVL